MTIEPRAFTHPGSCEGGVEDVAGAACHCITCGDVAEPMTVVEIDDARVLALCEDEAGERHTVEILLVQPVEIGQALLIHAGTAIAPAEVAA